MSQEERNGHPMPYGFFQMWHSSVFKEYVENSVTGAIDDYDFSKKFGDRITMLPLECRDVYGAQGHNKKNFYGVRNLIGWKQYD